MQQVFDYQVLGQFLENTYTSITRRKRYWLGLSYRKMLIFSAYEILK